MASHDSDSDSSSSDYTSTSVLLGYASTEPTEDPISQLGGYPTFPDPAHPPPAALSRCKACNSTTSLLLQLDANLPEHFPDHERRLYIFGCRRATCRRKEGCIRAIRGVKILQPQDGDTVDESTTSHTETEPSSAPKPNYGEAIFGGKHPSSTPSTSNPFSTSNPATPPLTNPFSTTPSASSGNTTPSVPPPSTLAAKPPQPPTETFASVLTLSTPAPASTRKVSSNTTPWPSPFSLPPPYPTYHLDAETEYLSAIPTTNNARAHPTLDDDAAPDPSSSSSAAAEAAAFESALDKPFQRFADTLAQNPEQVLRYGFGGGPLLCSSADGVGRVFAADGGGAGIPRCASCGAARVFEVQLVPHAIAVLERGAEEEEGLEEGMEWATVVVGVCGRDCVVAGDDGGGWVEEWVGVQWEERGRG
ncbi:MAG: hypothetical protein M1833_004223 [Piccolia ochrophora]|nr:MAG: hypothetical protein M1833_004223 [Piccolia ochrophora]